MWCLPTFLGQYLFLLLPQKNEPLGKKRPTVTNERVKMLSEKRGAMLHGVLLIALFSLAAFYLGDMAWARHLSISPMIIGIVLGMFYANSLRLHLPPTWVPGIAFCAKRILRIGIILYGFRLTLQDVTAVGLPAIMIDAIVVTVTVLGGAALGKLLKIDRDIALLTSVGAGICGAAAVLGTEGAINTKPYKTAVAVSTVVIFGTLSMFLYPILYRNGLLDLPHHAMGIMTGATVHEVAHVVGAGNAMGKEVSDVAIIVKMIRVMMLVLVLLLVSWWASRRPVESEETPVGEKTTPAENAPKRRRIAIPWFAVLFLLVIGFNSLDLLPPELISGINTLDTFLLTMAMTALGAETSFDKFKKAGAKPFLLAALLFAWLLGGGYLMAKYLLPLLG